MSWWDRHIEREGLGASKKTEVGRDRVKAQGEGAVTVHTQGSLVPTQPSTLKSTAHTILEDSETLFSPSFTHL